MNVDNNQSVSPIQVEDGICVKEEPSDLSCEDDEIRINSADDIINLKLEAVLVSIYYCASILYNCIGIAINVCIVNSN